MILLNPNVGVAPGTTTMQLSGRKLGCLGGCPPDPVRYYTEMPQTTAMNSPGFTPQPMLQSAITAATPSTTTAGPALYYPYTSLPQLRGLGDDGMDVPRFGLAIFAGIAVFLGVIGYTQLRRRV